MTERIRTPRRTVPTEPSVRPRRRFERTFAAGRFNWRWVSLTLLIGNIALMVFIFTDPMFYVTRIEVGWENNVHFVPAEEIFASSGVARYHILWIDPREVERRIEASPSIASAQVILQWPAHVVIQIREREPSLVWEQGGDHYWVDINGNLMEARQEVAGLVRVINEGQAIPFQCPGSPGCPTDANASVTIDPAVVLGAQQLKSLRSNIDVLYYDPVRGLSYQDGRGWRSYFGIGTDMDARLVVYERLVADLQSRGITPTRIDVSNLSAPYYSVAP